MTTPQRPNSEFPELGRLVTLIDGVYAVALTLLVLDLKLPQNTSLVSSLKQMLPGFLVYLITFASIAGYWMIHHGTFRYIAHGDGQLVFLSLLNLLFVTLFPLSASIVGAHPLEPLATVCLSANSLLYCMSAWAIWSHAAANRNLLAKVADYHRLQQAGRMMVFVAAGLTLAIPLTFLSVYLAYAIWILYTPIAGLWLRVRRRHST
jgi:uncharacterized membrane protein